MDVRPDRGVPSVAGRLAAARGVRAGSRPLGCASRRRARTASRRGRVSTSAMSSTGTMTSMSSALRVPASTMVTGRGPRRAVVAAEEAGDLLERALGGREADALRRALGCELLEPLEGEREVRAALGGGDGVDLVDDHRLDASARVSRACDVSIRYSDSGVVIRMSGGVRDERGGARRPAVSPVRRPTVGSWNGTPSRSAGEPDAGERRAQVLLDVDRERPQRRDVEHPAALVLRRHRVRSPSRSIAQRNAASVLPEPVGARSSVWSPPAIAGQPPVCGGVGAAKVASNHARTAGENCSTVTARRYRAPATRPPCGPWSLFVCAPCAFQGPRLGGGGLAAAALRRSRSRSSRGRRASGARGPRG